MADSESSLAVRRKRLADRPWLALALFLLFYVISVVISTAFLYGVAGLSQSGKLAPLYQQTTFHILMLFLVTPFLLRLPSGHRSFGQYVDEIRLSHNKPLGRLLFLGFSCWAIMALCQALGSIVFHLSRGLRVSGDFMCHVFDLTGSLPPRSTSLINSLPTLFEEIAFRGVILTLFLRNTTRRKAIIASSLGFGVLHLMNLGGDRAAVWVLAQVVWASMLGIFYAYVTIVCDSLLPTMIIHTMSNVFIGSITAPIQDFAPSGVQAFYGLVFTVGLLPTALMGLWAWFLFSRWRQSQMADI